MRKYVLGTRGSELALTQSRHVAACLMALSSEIHVRIEIITSKGDKIQNVPLAKIGAKGVFTKELEIALLEGCIDLAVHSLKDLPTELPAGLCIGAIPERVTPNDVLVAASGTTLDQLPHGARIGTSSLRRKVQLLAIRPDLEMLDIRGNVPTRIEKLRRGDYDAIILAAAGMERLGLAGQITEYLSPKVMLPAVGQGALAVEIRQGDTELAALLAQLHEADHALCVEAERALLRGMGGGCQVPIGAWAQVEGGTLTLDACVCSADGKTVHRLQLSGDKSTASQLGLEAALHFKEKGAGAMVAVAAAQEAGESAALQGARIVLTRAVGAMDTLREQLEARGAETFAFPCIEIKTSTTVPALPDASSCDWLVFTSANALHSFEEHLRLAGRALLEFQRCAICAIGPATARALQQKGMIVSLSPDAFNADSLVEAFSLLEEGIAGKHFLLPRGNLARPALPEALRTAGAQVTECVVYETLKPAHSKEAVQELLDFAPNVLTFTSSSTVQNFKSYFAADALNNLLSKSKCVSIGPETSKTLDAVGMPMAVEAESSDAEGVLRAIMELFNGK